VIEDIDGLVRQYYEAGTWFDRLVNGTHLIILIYHPFAPSTLLHGNILTEFPSPRRGED
jgi:hypothetical protein